MDDRYVYEVVSMVASLTTTSAGQVFVANSHFINVLLQLFLPGSYNICFVCLFVFALFVDLCCLF